LLELLNFMTLETSELSVIWHVGLKLYIVANRLCIQEVLGSQCKDFLVYLKT
jgi:hypothetical protein